MSGRLPSRRAVPAATARALACAAAGLAVGCYQVAPLDLVPVGSGQTVVLDLTDQGRVAMSESVGPGVRSLTGRLVAATEGAVVLRLTQVVDVNNVPQTWAGESLSVERRYLARSVERRPDRLRTALLAGGVAALIIGYFANRSLFGQGIDPVGPPGTPPPNDQ